MLSVIFVTRGICVEKDLTKEEEKRQSNNALRGYIYQIWTSVLVWLDLDDESLLFLEVFEDIDVDNESSHTAFQVKNAARKISLRDKAVIDAINHYWQLRLKYPSDKKVVFRFLTTSTISTEKGNPFGKGVKGLEVWRTCSGNT